MRTSVTHPLKIAEVRAAPSYGRVGITFCPGKYQTNAMTGIWQRDLCLDVQAIAEFGAAVVVTLIEDQELEALQVQGLGAEIRRRHMAWLHLPIVDVSVPCDQFRGCVAGGGTRPTRAPA